MDLFVESLFRRVTLSRDQETLQRWSRDVLEKGLYREDGLAQFAFRGEHPMYAMSYIPGIAWVLYHGSRFGPRIIGSVYVRPDMRRRGIGRRFAAAVHELYQGKIISTLESVPMVEIIEKVTHDGKSLVRCRCSCGATFHAFEDDEEVKSCGHPRAGNLLDLLITKEKSS